MSETVQCPACGHNNKIDGLVSLKPASINCTSCKVQLQAKGVTFSSVVIKMFIAIIVMNVGLTSILVYLGISESIANGIGLVCAFILMYFLIVKSKKWDVMEEQGNP